MTFCPDHIYLREGARRLLLVAVETELEEFFGAMGIGSGPEGTKG